MRSTGVLAFIAAVMGLFSLGGSCEEIPVPNGPPNTFFQEGGAPPETLLVDNFTFRWYGTDPDSDLRDYYYRLFVGPECADDLPVVPDTSWINTRDQTKGYVFADVDSYPDGHYVFQVASADEYGELDPSPLRGCFIIAIQLPPVVDSLNLPTPRTGGATAEFSAYATKFNRQGDPLPDITFEYDWQATRITGAPETIELFGEWLPNPSVTLTGLTAGAIYLVRAKVRDKAFPLNESEIFSAEWQN